MGRSQETFSKKEKEKKRIQKRKEKEEKKAERKANSDKGKSFEEMLAYVDENGNLTTTPPDPKKKKTIRTEDITIDVAKGVDPVDEVYAGVVTFFNTDKGYGFIKEKISGESIFVHINDLSAPLVEQQKVNFKMQKGLKGMQAHSVEVVK
jgi:cold shock CspA family protein